MKQSLPAILATFALSLGVAAPSLAQQAQQQQQGTPSPAAQAQAQAAQVKVTDDDLEQFVEAKEKVADVRQSFQKQMAEAENSKDAQKLQQEASGEMVSAVEASGLSVDKFNQIAYAVQAQPDLQSRLEKLQ